MSKKPRHSADDGQMADTTKPRTPLQKLKKAWKKADPAERSAFLLWLSASGTLPEQEASPADDILKATVTISTGRYLHPTAASRIGQIMVKRSMSPGDIMGELGFSPQDTSLHHALARNYPLRIVVIEALKTWLAKNSAV